MYCPLGHGMHGEHPFEKGVHRPDFQKPSTQPAGHGLQMSQPVSSSSPKKNPLSHVHAPQSHKSSLIFPSRRAPAVLNKRLSPFRGGDRNVIKVPGFERAPCSDTCFEASRQIMNVIYSPAHHNACMVHRW